MRWRSVQPAKKRHTVLRFSDKLPEKEKGDGGKGDGGKGDS